LKWQKRFNSAKNEFFIFLNYGGVPWKNNNAETAIKAVALNTHPHEKGTDEIGNGISLCALHDTAYDRSLIYFDDECNIFINNSKMEYLEKVGLGSGCRKFQGLAFDKIQLPANDTVRPNIENIKVANQAGGIN
jgi:putative restriction endonuclease